MNTSNAINRFLNFFHLNLLHNQVNQNALQHHLILFRKLDYAINTSNSITMNCDYGEDLFHH